MRGDSVFGFGQGYSEVTGEAVGVGMTRQYNESRIYGVCSIVNVSLNAIKAGDAAQ